MEKEPQTKPIYPVIAYLAMARSIKVSKKFVELSLIMAIVGDFFEPEV